MHAGTSGPHLEPLAAVEDARVSGTQCLLELRHPFSYLRMVDAAQGREGTRLTDVAGLANCGTTHLLKVDASLFIIRPGTVQLPRFHDRLHLLRNIEEQGAY